MQDSQASCAESLFLIRVEGQNFKWVMDDTHDLSTIAGGSRLLAKLPEQVKATLDECLAAGKLRAVETIQSAASIGLFVICPASADIEQIVGAVKKTLSRGDFSHLTVSVNWIAAGSAVLSNEGGGLTIPKEALKEIDAKLVDRLMAAARFAQMRAPNVAVPAMVQYASEACCEDHVRPVEEKKEEEPGRSASVNARRRTGKLFRWKWAGNERESVHTFEEMTASRFPRHHGKIAVISIDGKGFTYLRNKYCQHTAGIQQFSRALVSAQQTFLDSLLAAWATNETDRFFFPYRPTAEEERVGVKPGNLLRFQRLVTAGDDAVYLMPAWLAWEFLEKFFNHPWTLTLTGKDDNDKEVQVAVPLAFRAGVVICSAKAPIHPIRDLAGRLEAEIARETANPGIKNPVAYEILKSFDLIGPRLDEYRKERRKSLTAAQIVLDGTTMSATKTRLEKMNGECPSAEIKNWQRWPSGQESDAYHLSQWRDYIF
jgi:hypothetical protein